MCLYEASFCCFTWMGRVLAPSNEPWLGHVQAIAVLPTSNLGSTKAFRSGTLLKACWSLCAPHAVKAFSHWFFWSEYNSLPVLSRRPTKPSRFTQTIVGTIHTGDKSSCIGVDIPEINETIIIREFLACQHLHDTADSGLKHTCNLLVKESYLLIFTYLLILEIQPEGICVLIFFS